jgi:chromate transporter
LTESAPEAIAGRSDVSRTATLGPDDRIAFSLAELCFYFLRLGTLGFGGPIALVGYMQRDLVERRRWISEQDFREGLALAQLAPGPLAAQLAIYLGRVRSRVFGATLIAFAFVLPSFLMVLAISAFYVRFGNLSWMQGAFYGIGAAVIAIIIRSAIKLTRVTLARNRLLWAIFAVNALITATTESEILWSFLLSGIVALLIQAPPRLRSGGTLASLSVLPAWLLTGLTGPASPGVLWTIGLYFAEAGAFVFGSGLAIVPFLHGGVVERYQWLTDRQFLDAVAVAMITPGPVVITVSFIGYLVAGPAGTTVAALGIFLPCYLLVIIPAPYFRRISRNRQMKAFVDGVTSAATGAIAGSVFVLGRRAIIDIPTSLILAGTYLVLVKARKVPEPVVILAAGMIGFLLTRSR